MAKKNDKSGSDKGKNTGKNKGPKKASAKKSAEKRNDYGHPGGENLQPWAKGQSGNPNGRPKGRRNQSTVIWEAMKFLAEKREEKTGEPCTPEDIETELNAAAIVHALRNHNFYNSVMDRLHRRPNHEPDPREADEDELADDLTNLSDEQLRRIAEGG